MAIQIKAESKPSKRIEQIALMRHSIECADGNEGEFYTHTRPEKNQAFIQAIMYYLDEQKNVNPSN